jgi:hypothetical protein
MIASGYSAIFYCDCRECNDQPWMQETAEFTGEKWADVARQARKRKWRFNRERTLCWAPGHKRRKDDHF